MTVPDDTPVTNPVPPKIATDIDEEVKVPPIVLGTRGVEVVPPAHIDEGPVIAPGTGFTVIIFTVEQPVPSV